jgi:quercetin dioxygenase-like cupin family protein
MTGGVNRGSPQSVLVKVEAGGKIPLHVHKVDAEMYIVGGSAIVLSDDETNGTLVNPGARVMFKKNESHGFEAGPEGLVFVSFNGGIVDFQDTNWDISFH